MKRYGRHLGALGSIVAVLLIATGWTTSPAPPAAPPPSEAAARLAVGVSLGHFIDIIGREPEITRAAGGYQEALWIDRTWAVQAVVGPFAEVQGYSVTTRDPQFRPPVPPVGDTRLGLTPLDGFWESDLADLGTGLGGTPDGQWYYSEALLPSGATRDRSIVLTASDGSEVGVTDATLEVAGRLTLQFDALTSTPRGPLLEFALEPRVPQDRHRLIPTTYSVLGPALPIDRLPETFRFGPTIDDVLAVVGPG